MLSQAQLQEFLHYDQVTGLFTWLKHRGRLRIGDIAGNLNADGYIHIRLLGRVYKAHRLAWLYMEGAMPKTNIDHRNRIRHDNRWKNLRLATKEQNGQNKSKGKNNKHGYVGVHLLGATHKWQAFIVVNRKKIHLGTFATVDAAGEAYRSAKAIYHSFQPRLTSAPAE